MGIEQKINYQLNKFPRLKRIIKRVYQRTMYILSPKIKSEGNIVRVSPDDPKHEYFFGYYDKSPWDRTDRYMLCMRANDTWSNVSPKEKADILIIDTERSENDPKRIRKVAETRAWNVQQSCMLQWLGPDFSSKILYNDFRNGSYCAVILTLETMEEVVIPSAVYTVANDGKTALTLDFSRLYNLRPGYGYYNVPEKTKGIGLPDSTAIWSVNLETGEVTALLKYTDFANFKPRPEMQETGTIHKVNHLMLSPNGKRFMVLYRWFVGHRKYTRLITCNIDGTDMYILSDDDMVSHCCWKNNSFILAFENKKKSGTGYYLMKDRTQEYIHCWPQLANDGHPSYSPDGRLIVTDSYPNRARVASINVMAGDEKNKANTTVARVFSTFKYDNDTRCDLHPRWNHKGDKICFDSVFEGHRGMYVVLINQQNLLNVSFLETESDGKTDKIDTNIDNELISVIIPVYNVSAYLERCVKSVMNQTYHHLEIILVDDGSTDDSGKICDMLFEQDNRIKVVHKENGGLSSARNAGLKVASGDFIGFVDSDDWIEPDTYEYMLGLLKKYKAEVADIECQYVYSDQDVIKKIKEYIEVYWDRDVLWNYFDRGLKLQNSAPYSVWRKLYKRKILEGRLFWEGKNSEDLLFNYEVLKDTKSIVISNQVKYHYFQNINGISIGPLKQADLGLLEVCEQINEKEKNNIYKNINQLTKIKLARSYFSLLARLATAGYVKSDFPEIKSVSKKFTNRLRKNFLILMKSDIPFNRKAMIVIFCIDYRIATYAYLILKKVRGK